MSKEFSAITPAERFKRLGELLQTIMEAEDEAMQHEIELNKQVGKPPGRTWGKKWIGDYWEELKDFEHGILPEEAGKHFTASGLNVLKRLEQKKAAWAKLTTQERKLLGLTKKSVQWFDVDPDAPREDDPE